MDCVELRWLVRKECTESSFGERICMNVRVLQYRRREEKQTVGGLPVVVWSEWIDVPHVKE